MKAIKYILLFAICLPGCTSKPDHEELRKEITEILEQDRRDHFEKNAERFTSRFPDSLLSVNRGVVRITGREDNRKRFENYFSRVEFIKWDDMAEPIIRFSDDGSMAYVIIQKQVILRVKDSLGNSQIDTTDYAWAEILRKTGDRWVGECNISTNK